MTRKIAGYRILDHHTGQLVSKLYGENQGRRARTRAEQLNQEYGAVRYSACIVWAES